MSYYRDLQVRQAREDAEFWRYKYQRAMSCLKAFGDSKLFGEQAALVARCAYVGCGGKDHWKAGPDQWLDWISENHQA